MKRVIAVVIVLLVICAGISLLPTSHEAPDLFARARRVPQFASNTVLFLRDGWSEPDKLSFREMSGPYNYVTVDIRTGSQTRRIINSLAPNSPGPVSCWSSPDGAFMLANMITFWRLSRVTGEVVREWPTWPANPLWAPDSSHWIAVDNARRFVRRYRRNAESASVFPLPQLPQTAKPLWYDGHERLALVGQFPGRSQEILVVNLLTRQIAVRRVVKLPPDTAVVQDVQGSPVGDRVAWYLGRRAKKFGWLERLLAAIKSTLRIPSAQARLNDPSMQVEGIWLSRPDGSEMQPLGEVKAEWAPEGMASFTWRPNGQSLLVTYRRGIYEVPVE